MKLSDRLDFWHFEDDYMVFQDGSVGVGYKVNGVDIACKTNDLINETNTKIEKMMNSLSKDYSLQVFYKMGSDYSELINKHEAISQDVKDQLRVVTDFRIENFRNKNKDKQFFNQEVYLFIRSDTSKYSKRKFFQSQKQFQNISKRDFEKDLEKFDREKQSFESEMIDLGIMPTQLSSSRWKELLFSYLNLDLYESGVRQSRNTDGYISDQVVMADCFIKNDHIKIGSYHYRALTLKTLPDGFTTAAMIESFLDTSTHFHLVQNVKIQDQKKEVNKLKIQRRLAHAFASGAKNVSDIENESKLGSSQAILEEVIDGNEKIISMDFNVLVYSQDLSELDQKCDEILRAFQKMGHSEGVVETLASLNAFESCIPGMNKPFRSKLMKSSNASHLFPLYEEWRGSKNPVCLLPNRSNALTSFDPFDENLPNWNGLVFGSSGGGKSFLLLQLMLQFYAKNPRPRVVWIDNGASSKGLLESLDGEFIDLDIKSDIRLNVFDLDEGEKTPSVSKVKLILGVLENILKEDDRVSLPKKDKAMLEKAIIDVYQSVDDRTPRLGDLKDLLVEHSEKEMRDYAQILFSWTGDTAFGKILDAETNLKLSKDLTTIETKNLGDFPELENILLLIFTDFIKREASRNLDIPYLLIVDEAWKMFQTESGLSFIKEAYRTMRKYNAGIVCISQTYSDFLSDPKIKDALYPNTSYLYVLKQQVDDWSKFADCLGFNEAEVQLVKSLSIVKGEFSEVFIRQNTNSTVLRVVPDRLSYWISTSDPKDKAIIEHVMSKCEGLSRLKYVVYTNCNKESFIRRYDWNSRNAWSNTSYGNL